MALRPRTKEERRSPPSPEVAVPSAGGVTLALLTAHQWNGPDGVVGGTPHLHAVATETYLAVAGEGRLLVLDRDGSAEHQLSVGTAVTCAPGTLARVVNDGELVLVLVVEHAVFGLAQPDADVVIPGDATHEGAVAAMREVSDALAVSNVEPYVRLHREVPERLTQRLDALVQANIGSEDPATLAQRRLQALAAHDAHHLLDAATRTGIVAPPCADLVGTVLHR